MSGMSSASDSNSETEGNLFIIYHSIVLFMNNHPKFFIQYHSHSSETYGKTYKTHYA